MKLFGTYLMEKGLISKSQLLEVLVEQTISTPHISEIIFNGCLLPESSQLEIIEEQQKSEINYIDAAKKLNLWTEELAAKVRTETKKSRKMLGEIIIAKGFVSFEAITKSLDEFIGTIALDKAPIQSISGSLPSPENKARSKPSRVERKLNFPEIDQSLTKEIMDLHNNVKIAKICDDLTESLSKSNEQKIQILDTIAEEFSTLESASRFVRLELLNEIHKKSASVLSISRENIGNFDQNATSLLINCLKISKSLVDSLGKSFSEREFWENMINRESYEVCLEELESILSKISGSKAA